MKRLLCMCLLISTAILSGCGVSSTSSSTEGGTDSGQPVVKDRSEDKKLVVYFSMPETTSPDNMSREEELSTVVIDGEVMGNTQYVAHVIEQNTGADVFRIEPVKPYPLDHAALEDIAQKEQQENARPEIAGVVENMKQYDTVFFGFPNWYFDMPQIMYSFLDQYDLSGKTIVPFVTSGASGFSDAISTIEQMEPDADVITDGLSISRDEVQDSEEEIIQWLTDKGFIQ